MAALQKRPEKNPAAKNQEEPYRVNEKIKAPIVRVVGDNFEQRIVTIKEALEIADQMELDLVEISPNANPPVCKLIDYSKFMYELKRKQKEAKAKAAKVILKEIRLGPNTDEHDFNFKLNHARKFLEEGAKVKVEVLFKGRTIVYKEKGEIILLEFAQALEDIGKLESLPKLEGKRMFITIAPKKS
ncbi:MAG TPA: translation initiation factor IF-3 [Bacteroidales bacterium]|nr:translation initiation factor IF-3 [Bacteroidales bacterium]MDI9573838.1 translation initiation factor IF-3 [Bacteroidota bacterium]MBP9511812.1 translation initiation factor IF-3 [Bacteroidales bacterium]MBP9589141.1 translation initiation factor IF-3 [Bacteroidales bacterium]NMD16036.1 translation initiation factor IF-3 [Bacteroidales bacterium]